MGFQLSCYHPGGLALYLDPMLKNRQKRSVDIKYRCISTAKAALNYNKHYIGLEIDEVSRNFVVFRPKKAHVLIEFKLPDQGDEVKAKIEEAEMRTLTYDAQFKYFRISLDRLNLPTQREIIKELSQQAWELYGKP